MIFGRPGGARELLVFLATGSGHCARGVRNPGGLGAGVDQGNGSGSCGTLGPTYLPINIRAAPVLLEAGEPASTGLVKGKA